MKDLSKTLLQLGQFFTVFKKRWFIGVLSLPLIYVCAIILKNTSSTANTFVKALLIALIALASVTAILWISSYIAIPIIKKKLNAIYVSGPAKPVEEFAITKPFTLSMAKKLKADYNLTKLKLTSVHRFRKSAQIKDSYIRMQFLAEGSVPRNLSVDTLLTLEGEENHSYQIPISYNGESCTLTISREFDKKGRERVFLKWSLSTHTNAPEAAEVIELTQNEPAVLAYDLAYEQSNGEELYENKVLCAFTWIGGNV